MPITALFLDIGGVLLTNGWDHHGCALAAKTFDLDLDEMEDRHHLTFDTCELGKLTLEQYSSRVVFYQKRPFTPGQFREFMFAQSRPFPQMIELVRKPKAPYGLKIAVVSHEGRELTVYRIRRFNVACIEDRPMFVQVAETLGIRGIHHIDYKSTLARLASIGLKDAD